MRIQHNIMAMSAYRNYNTNTSAVAKNLEKLSSGYKINRAGDDAAGLAISEKMRAQITGLNAAQKNVKDGISLVKTAEGAMQEIQDMLNRMDYLATQSANGTYDNEVDRAALQKEVDQLLEEIDRIAESANFNGIQLLNGDWDVDGATVTVDGSSRIIDQVWNGAGDPSAVTGEQTILDGDSTTAQKTVFTMDFSDLKAVAGGAGGAAGGGFTAADALPNGVSNVAATGLTTAGDVKMSFTTAAADTGATAVGADGLADLTFTDADAQGSIGNDINFKFVFDSTQAADKAEWDQASNTVTVTLKNAKEYAASDIQTLVQTVGNKTGDGGIDFSNFEVTGTGKIDTQTSNNNDVLGNVTLAGGADTGDKTVTVTTPEGTATQTIAAADWAGNVAINAGGVTATIDADNTTWDGTEATIGTVAAPAAGGGAPAGDITTSVKLNGTDIAADVEIEADDTAEDIVKKVFAEMNGTAGAVLEDFEFNGAKYDVEVDGTKLKFTLKDDPTADNIKGNFDWDVSITGGKYEGNHTAGTNVVTAGSVANAAARANTVFEITTDDLKDGTEITIDGKTVTLSVGSDSKVAAGTGVVKLTDAEAADLDLALSKISAGFGGSTDNFEISVNNGGNNDAKVGLAIYKKADSTETYKTKDQLANVFSMKTKVGGGGQELKLQIGDTSESYNQLGVKIGSMKTTALGISGLNIGTAEKASAAINTIKNAINQVSSVRGDLGAYQNRLEHTANNLSVMAENIQDAESSIRDTDIAEEMMSYTKNNILVQSAQAMLAQANQVPQGVLQLLG